jgi:hypothetical protein
MVTIIKDELKIHLDKIDFDKDEYKIIVDLLASLKNFDQMTSADTLHTVRPKLELWI